jgi:hypothetical protein
MMPRAKTKLGRFIENTFAYGLIGIIVLGLLLSILSPIVEWFQTSVTFGPIVP